MVTPLSKLITIENLPLLSKFRGALVGAVVGDCLGAYYENEKVVNLQSLTTFISGLSSENASGDLLLSAPSAECQHVYTDDTAMARSVAMSLIEQKSFDGLDMAKRFVSEFESSPSRGYGANIGHVFRQLRDDAFSSPFGPAATQFNGSGSYGNGAAMRIAPAALFGYNHSARDLRKLSGKISQLTHTHRDAVQGARLQCAAVCLALTRTADISIDEFVSTLRHQMEPPGTDDAGADGSLPSKRHAQREPYGRKLDLVRDFTVQQNEIGREEVVDKLGNDVSALGSVPTALYAFLRSTSPISDIQTKNAFERTIVYAISLGGDTDTIATMAGAIAGATYGIDKIPACWQKSCEGVTDALRHADQLYDLLDTK